MKAEKNSFFFPKKNAKIYRRIYASMACKGLRRAKSKVVWYSKMLGKDKNSYCRQIFDKDWGKCKLRGRRRKQWKNV